MGEFKDLAGLCMNHPQTAADEMMTLRKQLAAALTDKAYAWKNTHVLEEAYQQEREKAYQQEREKAYQQERQSREAQQARITELREALESIKDRVCGEAHPNWENTPATGVSRGWIADVCDTNLTFKPDDLSALESIKRQARREALMEAAEVCDRFSSRGMSPSECADCIRRMAEEVKP